MESKKIIRDALLILWASLTFVLLFSLLLLGYDVIQRASVPSPVSEGSPPRFSPKTHNTNTADRRNVSLFFANKDCTGLVPETRELVLTPFTQDNCKIALAAMIEGPITSHFVRTIPASTIVRNVYLLEDGTLVVDLSREIQTDNERPKSAGVESLMIYSIVNTLTQSALQGDKEPEVRRVQLLFEGATFPPTFPEHLDFSLPYERDPSWIVFEHP